MHARAAFIRRHLHTAKDRLCDFLDVIGIDEQRALLQLGGRSGEFTQDQDAVALGACRAELLADEIHAVFQRGYEGDFAGAVVGEQFVAAETAEYIVDRDPAGLGELAVDFADESFELHFEGVVFGYVLAARDGYLDQGHAMVQFGKALQGVAEGFKAVADALGVIETVNAK